MSATGKGKRAHGVTERAHDAMGSSTSASEQA